MNKNAATAALLALSIALAIAAGVRLDRADSAPAELPPVVIAEPGPVPDLAPAAGGKVTFQSEAAAWGTRTRLWVHVTASEGCGPCRDAEALFAHPDVVAAARGMACCQLDVKDPKQRARAQAYFAAAKIPNMSTPADFIVEVDRRVQRPFVGAPAGAKDLCSRLRPPNAPTLGAAVLNMTCPECNGEGALANERSGAVEYCDVCHGDGRVTQTEYEDWLSGADY